MAASPRRAAPRPPRQAGPTAAEPAAPEQRDTRPHGAGSVAFLLAQLGAYAADRFAARIAAVGLTPPQAGILRAIAVEPGRSQQALSQQLDLLPSRVVAFVDELEDRGYVERRRHPGDRRLHALHLTAGGQQMLAEIGKIGRAHEEEITGSLTASQHEELAATLQALAVRHGLTPGVHPGYRSLGRDRANGTTGGTAAG